MRKYPPYRKKSGGSSLSSTRRSRVQQQGDDVSYDQFSRLLETISPSKQVSDTQIQQQFLKQSQLPVLFIQVHGDPPKSSAPKLQLHDNEYIICPNFNELMPTCYGVDFILPQLKSKKSLSQVVQVFSGLFPLQYSSTGTRSKSFQVFDSTKPCPDLIFTTAGEGNAEIINVNTTQKVLLDKERFQLHDILTVLRDVFPNGWIFCIYACTWIGRSQKPRTLTQEFQRWIQQAQLQTQSGVPIQAYLPITQSLPRSSSSPIFRKKLNETLFLPYPIMESIKTAYGHQVVVKFGDRRLFFDVVWKDDRNNFMKKTILYIDQTLYKEFPIRSIDNTKTEKLVFDWMSGYVIYFRPISVDLIQQRYHSVEFRIDYQEAQVDIIEPNSSPWRTIKLTKNELDRWKRSVPLGMDILKMVRFKSPFQFSFLVFRDVFGQVHLITEENRLFSQEEGEPVFHLADIIVNPQKHPLTHIIDVKVLYDVVEIYQHNVLINT